MVLSTSNLQLVAQICHEANRAYCIQLGDFSQFPWSEAPDWQRESARAGIVGRIKNPNATPAEQHEAWRKFKQAAGWTCGVTKNVGAKTHPCMVPFEQLPLEQQMKDRIFCGICSALLPLFADPE